MGFKILLTENTSPVGAALFKSLENYAHPVICPDFDLQTWCDEQSVNDLLEATGPVVVISTYGCGYFTALAEEPRICEVLAKSCAQKDLTVIHLSSHAVFSMAQQAEFGAASETLRPEPDSALGEALRHVELAFAETRRSIILRLSPLLDGQAGMLEVACRALCDRAGVIASERWRLTPVFVEDVVRTVVAMLQQILCGAENWGVFHLHSSDACSEAEFVDCVARSLHKLGVDLAALTGSSGDEQFFASNGWLQGNRCTNDFGVQNRSWRKGIKNKVQAWTEAEVSAGSLRGPEM